MKSFNAAPGFSCFMNCSPIRKPRKPASSRKRFTTSGFEMPLSLTRQTSLGSCSANRKLFSTSVTKVPRLRLLMPYMSGSSSAYSKSRSLCISKRTSNPS